MSLWSARLIKVLNSHAEKCAVVKVPFLSLFNHFVKQWYLENGSNVHCHFITKLMAITAQSFTTTHHLHSYKGEKGWGFAKTLTFAFMDHPYLVCILFGMPSLHLFYIFNVFYFLVILYIKVFLKQNAIQFVINGWTFRGINIEVFLGSYACTCCV